MRRFLFKLNPPRLTFPQDMTEAERKVMQVHLVYWKGLADKGTAIVFGLVIDPKGTWGVAIVETADEAEARALVPNDPVFKASLGMYELYPLGPNTIVRK